MKINRGHKGIKKLVSTLCVIGFLLCGLYFIAPQPLFKDPYSFVLFDREGQLAGAKIAPDGQWRFPLSDSLPDKYLVSLLTFEDRRFYWHPGIDFLSLGRAIAQNIRAGSIASGGSTITMQVARMARGNPPRTLKNKLIEMVWALSIELQYSKREILQLYAGHAPFGGNVVGMEMAAHRYFGSEPATLTWAGAATLAVLPNSPALIHPGRNQQKLKIKRDLLLDKLCARGIIDSTEWYLSRMEEIPPAPSTLPDDAMHFMEYGRIHYRDRRLQSTMDTELQRFTRRVGEHHQDYLKQNSIHNLAILVLDTKTGEVLAYLGNVDESDVPEKDVDMIQAARSSGSILKPFLYAAAWDEGLILPGTLIDDIPVSYRGYRPENFIREYDGMVPASDALVRSLNVPAVGLLGDYGIDKFKTRLIELGVRTIKKPAEHYGLTLILGGAEVSLWDLTSAYAGIGRTLLDWDKEKFTYNRYNFSLPIYSVDDSIRIKRERIPAVYSAGASWSLLNTLYALNRPGDEGSWEKFNSTKKIAWKTGTSYGFRDAWAIGVSPEVTIGVWVGNADGEGRPGIIGSKAAAPILFDMFSYFKSNKEFAVPYDDLEFAFICSKSGYLSSTICPQADTVMVPRAGLKTGQCPYHEQIYIDDEGNRVDLRCADREKMTARSWFVLPPAQAHYYGRVHADYRVMPSFLDSCGAEDEQNPIAIVYPRKSARLYLPVELDGEKESTVLEAVHRRSGEVIHWHLDGKYLSSTRDFHKVSLATEAGWHRLVIVDGEGNRDSRDFEVVSD